MGRCSCSVEPHCQARRANINGPSRSVTGSRRASGAARLTRIFFQLEQSVHVDRDSDVSSRGSSSKFLRNWFADTKLGGSSCTVAKMRLPRRIPWASPIELDQLCTWIYADETDIDAKILALHRVRIMWLLYSMVFLICNSFQRGEQ